MLISNKNFSVCPITTHVNVKSITKNLTKEKIINKVITINKWFIDFKKKTKNCYTWVESAQCRT